MGDKLDEILTQLHARQERFFEKLMEFITVMGYTEAEAKEMLRNWWWDARRKK